MKKVLLLLMAGSLSFIYQAQSADDALMLAVNTNFQPARPAPAQPQEQPAQPSAPPAAQAPATPAQPSTPPAAQVPATPVPPPPAPTAAPPPPPPAPAAMTPAPAAAPMSDADRQAIEEAAHEEIVRRQEAALAARKMIADGNVLYQNGKYEEAAARYEAALKALPRAPATADDYENALEGFSRASLQIGDRALSEKDFAKAKAQAQAVLAYDPYNRKANRLLARADNDLRAAQIRAQKPLPPASPAKTPEFVEKKDEVKELFRQGKILNNSGQYDEAARKFEQILLLDPYNDDAYTMLDEVNKARLNSAVSGTDKTRSLRLWEVSRSWLPSVGREVRLPGRHEEGGPVRAEAVQQEAIIRKLNSIVLPEINFRDAVITDVVNYLSSESRKLDPEHVGVNVVLNLGETGGTPAPAAPAVPTTPMLPTTMPPGAFGPGGPVAALPAPAPVEGVEPRAIPESPEQVSTRRISVTLRQIPMIDALRLITTAAGLKFRIEPHAVVVLPKDAPEGEMITRTYPVAPGVIRTVISAPEGGAGPGGVGGAGGGGAGAVQRMGGEGVAKPEDVKLFFVSAGVPFPTGSSLVYNERASRIIIHNTPENMEIFEDILREMNETPPQVEIEAKFIDISQSDLDELGFDWSVGQMAVGSFTTTGGSVPFGTSPDLSTGQGVISGGLRNSTAIQGNAIDALLASGGSSAIAGATPNNVATLRGVLTNPQFQVVVHALAQKKSTDLLSAPKITTISGNAAQIRVVQEFIYPTEYEPPQVGNNVVSPPIPGGFKTREVGVLLNVTPTVGPDKYTITMTVIPEVSEFLGFINYSPGETINIQTIVNTTGPPTTLQTSSPNIILQPLFASRNLTTSVVLWDGQTLVLGGLITESINKIDDKIPFLGDIPLLGRLFRSKVDSRTKRNLLVFVTARLVDPAGNPINKPEVAAAITGAPREGR